MPRPVTVLLVADDPDFAAEWQAAQSGLVDHRVLTHSASTPREAVQLAASRQPDVVCLALATSTDAMANLVRDIVDVVPHAAFLAVLDRRQFENGDAESQFVVGAMRAGVRDFLRRPLSSNELMAALRRVGDGAAAALQPRQKAGRVACFVSNKGGVGKTTLAVNVACELARRAPGRVLLVDAALQLGLCATMLDLDPAVTMHDIVTQMDRLDATLLRELTVSHDCGLDLLAAPGDAVEAAAVTEESLSRILAVARSAYDYVIVDTFPILDGIAIATLDRSDEVWQVIAPLVPVVLGAERLIGLLESVGVERERQRLIVNVSVPAHSGRLSPQNVADRLGRDIDLVVPFTRAAVSACNTGRPVVLASSRVGRFRRRIIDLADRVAGHATVPAGAALEADE
ncbi:MAG: AAA family ATPase [bacterium]|nr:AAA family ATPase [bacterium]